MFPAVVELAIMEKMETCMTVKFKHEPHPHTVTVSTGTATPPVVTADQHPTDTRVQRFNAWLAVKISVVVAVATAGMPLDTGHVPDDRANGG